MLSTYIGGCMQYTVKVLKANHEAEFVHFWGGRNSDFDNTLHIAVTDTNISCVESVFYYKQAKNN